MMPPGTIPILSLNIIVRCLHNNSRFFLKRFRFSPAYVTKNKKPQVGKLEAFLHLQTFLFLVARDKYDVFTTIILSEDFSPGWSTQL